MGREADSHALAYTVCTKNCTKSKVQTKITHLEETNTSPGRGAGRQGGRGHRSRGQGVGAEGSQKSRGQAEKQWSRKHKMIEQPALSEAGLLKGRCVIGK